MIQQDLNVQSTPPPPNASLQVFYVECLASWKCVFFKGILILEPWKEFLVMNLNSWRPISDVKKIFIVSEQIPSFLSFHLCYPLLTSSP